MQWFRGVSGPWQLLGLRRESPHLSTQRAPRGPPVRGRDSPRHESGHPPGWVRGCPGVHRQPDGPRGPLPADPRHGCPDEANEALTVARRPAVPAPEVFLDASFFLALLKPEDSAHPRALRWARHYMDRPRLTTTLALTEACDKHPTRERWRAFDGFLTKLRADLLVTVVSVDAVLLDRAADFKRKHPARSWGLADCVSFVVMGGYKVTDALAGDKHFAEAGFDALLLHP
jgi:predicted nucleic acid-binding protein